MRGVRHTVALIFAMACLCASAGWVESAGPSMTAYAKGECPQPTPSPSPSPSGVRKKGPPPKYVEVGKSVKGNSIWATVYGSGKKLVIILAGIHGNEQDTSIVAKSLSGSLGQEAGPEELTIVIVPDVNPDGLFANTRVNARGVDINRNFPSASWRSDYPDAARFPGIVPASEPETLAIIKLLERYPPDFVITLHAALGCVNWDGPGEQLARVIAPVNNYPLCPYLGYETPGSFGTYAGVDRKIPVVTIELRDAGATELVQENVPALRAVLLYMASAK